MALELIYIIRIPGIARNVYAGGHVFFYSILGHRQKRHPLRIPRRPK